MWPRCVPWRVDDVGGGRAELDGVAASDGLVEVRQAVGVGGGADDRALVACADFVCAGGVVGVVVGEQDDVQPAAAGVDCGRDRGGVGGVHDGDRAGGCFVQQPGIIVGEDGYCACGDVRVRRRHVARFRAPGRVRR